MLSILGKGLAKISTIAAGGLLGIGLPLGGLYWFWLAIKFGNFWMFVMVMFPPCLIVSAPVGLWSLLFGVPKWVIRWFMT